jgi:hypothetical protein
VCLAVPLRGLLRHPALAQAAASAAVHADEGGPCKTGPVPELYHWAAGRRGLRETLLAVLCSSSAAAAAAAAATTGLAMVNLRELRLGPAARGCNDEDAYK